MEASFLLIEVGKEGCCRAMLLAEPRFYSGQFIVVGCCCGLRGFLSTDSGGEEEESEQKNELAPCFHVSHFRSVRPGAQCTVCQNWLDEISPDKFF